MCLDSVRRKVRLVGDLRDREIGGQVAQDARLALTQWLLQPRHLALRRCGLLAEEEVEDLRDQSGMSSTTSGMPLEQSWLRVDQEERQERAVWLNEVQSSP